MKVIETISHITDVGAADNNGVDSSLRISRQYRRLGVLLPQIFPAGHSPLHVAFAACTDVSAKARMAATKAAEFLTGGKPELIPIALNCAPRNNKDPQKNGQERHIYRVRFENKELETMLIYGRQVLQWVLTFRGIIGVTVEEIISVKDLIKDTSSGSQFRSAEHLPIVHVLEVCGKLDEVAEKKILELDQIEEIFPTSDSGIVVAPHDEYGNGRLIMSSELADRIIERGEVMLPEIYEGVVDARESLTEVVAGKISIWRSSNYFPNSDLTVLNIGSRWGEGETRTKNQKVLDLMKKMESLTGEMLELTI